MHREPSPHERDLGTPTLLIVALVTVLAAVAGIVLVGASATKWAGLAALTVVLAGLVAVVATMSRQLDQDGEP